MFYWPGINPLSEDINEIEQAVQKFPVLNNQKPPEIPDSSGKTLSRPVHFLLRGWHEDGGRVPNGCLCMDSDQKTENT